MVVFLEVQMSGGGKCPDTAPHELPWTAAAAERAEITTRRCVGPCSDSRPGPGGGGSRRRQVDVTTGQAAGGRGSGAWDGKTLAFVGSTGGWPGNSAHAGRRKPHGKCTNRRPTARRPRGAQRKKTSERCGLRPSVRQSHKDKPRLLRPCVHV